MEYYNYPMLRNRRNPFDIPVRRSPSAAPKVVSIPIEFVSSDWTRLEAAVRIQKVFRGFVVRKSMKKIAAIKKQVDEIERKLLQKETLDLIRREGKERLKTNETLMNLLLRLDSISGAEFRDCRKSVIKKVIMLQERLDAESQKEVAAESGSNLGLEDDSIVAENNTTCKGNTEVVEVKAVKEKMVEENERLMKMVMDLRKKNKLQSEMLNSLSKRVDILEKKQRSRSKKMRQASINCDA